jgi:hypothetical protein
MAEKSQNCFSIFRKISHMKVFAFVGVALLGFGLVSCAPSKEKMKEQFVKSCMGEIGEQADPKMKAMFKDYCECSGEKVVNKFSAKEIAAFNNMSKTELQAKLMPVIQTCLDELSQKAQTYQQSQAGTPAQ